MSNWSFKDVYYEVMYVLEGLCRKCNLTLLDGSAVDTTSTESSLVKNNDIERELNSQIQTVKECEHGDKTDAVSCKIPQNVLNHVLTSENIKMCDFISNEEKQDEKLCKDKIIKKSNQYNDSFDALTEGLKDVPLMANVNEVLIYHYALNLEVFFPEKYIDGSILLFIKPANSEVYKREFQMCLDCTLIDIVSVDELILPHDFKYHFHEQSCCCGGRKELNDDEKVQESLENNLCSCCNLIQNFTNQKSSHLNYMKLSYAVYGWCIRIWTENAHWPCCVRIKYKTNPKGPSLMWCTDQDGL